MITYRQFGHLLLCITVAWSLLGTFAAAAVTVYLSEAELGDGAVPSNLDLKLDAAAIGSTGSFNIWIKTNVLVPGTDLSLLAVGDSIRFADSTVPSYAPRWAGSTDGSISANGTTVLGMEAFAIPGFGSTGISPASAVNDAGYDPSSGTFHFATIEYQVVGLGATALWFLSLGDGGVAHSLTCTHFGVGDECRPKDAAYPAVDIPGVPGYPLNPTADGFITVVPEPAIAPLFGLTLLGLVRVDRRRRCQ